ncbi:hypothetical protein A1O1_08930 [Capronia coronata CBS 617.96]|uniref:Ubiquitin-like-conjugating enzyme ATG10 n=1 Tax=Capronia coronata CBS 617.96 TaxID=1182541 RepID=W9Y802_9EURO|nr:uncharacterized protein A1O1_08930 [Capronia coronata CBS 617.96]EXJ78529.1 hypothetical protein A1O1_08930 [Capronia coronata CBS 617.96]
MATLDAFPSITESEFVKACRALEMRSLDRLDGTDWTSIRWSGDELVIKQRRRVNDGDREVCNGNPKEEDGDEENMDPIEEACHDTLVRGRDDFGALTIDFSITLSPTYCVPVLWFSCPPIVDGKVFSLDQVYRILVPLAFQQSLRSVGVMGGISMAHHPVSDHPAFFVHPCNTHEALSALCTDKSLTPERYLILWLGLIGSSVGLHIPSKLFETDGS